MSQTKDNDTIQDTENVVPMNSSKYPILKLKKPLTVKGKNYTELSYDMDGMTADDCMRAEALRMKKFNNIPTLASAVDDPLHFCEFVTACCRAMPDMEEADLCRISRADYKEAAKLFAEDFTD